MAQQIRLRRLGAGHFHLLSQPLILAQAGSIEKRRAASSSPIVTKQRPENLSFMATVQGPEEKKKKRKERQSFPKTPHGRGPTRH